MQDELRRIEAQRKTGGEALHSCGSPIGCTVLDFWQWSASDLVSNATRGRLAEFIVARALGISTDGVRDEWGAYDLTTPEGVKVEVKSAAFVQSWTQQRHSLIQFGTRKTRAWDPNTNCIAAESKRQADVYVFALLAHKAKATLDPLDVSQWRFYVVKTVALDSRHSITLKSLEQLSAGPVEFAGLRVAVAAARL
jgi:hypothetical protein